MLTKKQRKEKGRLQYRLRTKKRLDASQIRRLLLLKRQEKSR